MEEQKYKTEYRAITKDGLKPFNEELKMHTDNGWIPQGDLQCSTVLIAEALPPTVKFFYSILISKTTKI